MRSDAPYAAGRSVRGDQDASGGGEIACAFVDEAQFLTEAQAWQLTRVADRLSIPVMAYGFRTDFRGQLFPGSQTLLAIADELREVRTIRHCGRKATMVVRMDSGGNAIREGARIEVGGNEKYVSYGRRHWEDAMIAEADGKGACSEWERHRLGQQSRSVSSNCDAKRRPCIHCSRLALRYNHCI